MVMVGILLILSSRPRSSRFTQPLTISHHGYDEIRRYISSEKEAVNFLLDKVGEPYITAHVNHLSDCPNARNAQHNIIPDILARNFPTGRQRINDSGATSSAEACFEVKTFSACPSVNLVLFDVLLRGIYLRN